MTTVIETRTPQETFALGRRLGQSAAPGTVYTLSGDLGAGKTVLAQGMADGLGIREIVNSPTFSILQMYEGGRLPFYHLDVYRIGDIEEMDEIGLEDCLYGGGVTLIEWAERIEPLLPAGRVPIRMERDPARGDDYRRITIETGDRECL